MPFTSAQIAKIMLHLNYPLEAYTQTWVTNRCNSVSSLSSNVETEAGTIITRLDSLETSMANFTDYGVQVKPDGTVFATSPLNEYNTSPLNEYKKQYNYWQKKLATILNLEINKQKSVGNSSVTRA